MHNFNERVARSHREFMSVQYVLRVCTVTCTIAAPACTLLQHADAHQNWEGREE